MCFQAGLAARKDVHMICCEPMTLRVTLSGGRKRQALRCHNRQRLLATPGRSGMPDWIMTADKITIHIPQE